jgi:Ca-activated chloride channel family protein
MLRTACYFFLALTMAGALVAQSQGDRRFRVDANMVLIPVTVMSRQGVPVDGLKSESFTVFDNRRPQPISAFYAQDVPSSIGIVLDLSGSMKGSAALERAALDAFADSFDSEDDVFALIVASNPHVLNRGADVRATADALRREPVGGETALCDTIDSALKLSRQSERLRRALFVISDGMDNHSRLTRTGVLRTAAESDTQIYAIAVAASRPGLKGVQLAEVQRGLAFLDDLAAQTGGIAARVWYSGHVTAAVTRIARAIRNQYVIGYRPSTNDATGRWHRVEVKVSLANAKVYARSGYQSR